MLQPVMHVLKQKKIILASGSPRRKELIENIGLKVSLCPSLFEEDLDPKSFQSFSDFVEETALQKVLEVENRLKLQSSTPDVVIGADTMVTLGGEMFGKPSSEAEAFDMLSRLSGRGHTVYTGVVVKTLQKTVKFTEKTDVFFGKLDDEQINGYIATGEPMDKAGGYGIQGIGGTFVERVEGDYFTVVGLPLYRLCSVLHDLFRAAMLKHVAVSPHRARADSVSLASSASCCSLGSLDHRHDSVNDLSLRTTTIKVFAQRLRPDIEYKTLSVTWGTSAREVVGTLLGKFRMRHRDPRLFYLSMEVRVRAAGLRTTLVLDDDARPAALQACHPKGYSKFSLQMRRGGLVKIYDSALMSSSQYKSLLISDRTTADELLGILLNCYDSREGVERFSLYEVCASQECERKLHPDDLPLLVLQSWTSDRDCHFRVRRNPRAPPLPPRTLAPTEPEDETTRALSALSLEESDSRRYSPVYKFPSIGYCKESKNDYLYI